MDILSLEQAFKEIENIENKFPEDAIEYVYNHEPNHEIETKIIYYLENFLDENILDTSISLWYSIVAEKHLSEKYLPLILNILGENDFSWDPFVDQCGYLLYLLCELNPKNTIESSLEKVKYLLENEGDNNIVFIFDVFFNEYSKNYKEELFSILKNYPNMSYLGAFLNIFVKLDLPKEELLPVIKEISKKKQLDYDKNGENFTLIDFFDLEESKVFISQLEKGFDSKYLDEAISHYNFRSYWKEVHSEYIKNDERIISEEDTTYVREEPKIGRNDPCICGSGKKFKKCCIDKYN
ncbi:MAG: SEC-C metal-binding domain-containing protein [Candidatus Sericytochromatia bacterium]